MAIFMTGDTHGDFSRLRPAAFYEQVQLTKADYLVICGDFGGIWDGSNTEQQRFRVKIFFSLPSSTVTSKPPEIAMINSAVCL